MKQRRPLFKPALILHGGAGNIERSRLPPELYEKYRASLLSYLRSTADLLNGNPDENRPGSNALDAAVHAVSLMEDDELFNCGRGSVFTTVGTVEMEASVMTCSLTWTSDEDTEMGLRKRGAGVMMVRNVRYPVRLAKEVLLRDGRGETGDGQYGASMHCQLAGPHVEKLAREWGLEFKPDEWFWTKRRWEEHRRGLEEREVKAKIDYDGGLAPGGDASEARQGDYLSQGTVGCVCLDKWGNLAVATSTGGLTNKFPGRIGDTPTLGAGFWAEAWDEEDGLRQDREQRYKDRAMRILALSTGQTLNNPGTTSCRRAAALSGTGNGDAFLRTSAARTAAAISRFSTSPGSSSKPVSLAEAVSLVAGPGGELARSPGPGTGGIVGIEAELERNPYLSGGAGDTAINTDSNLIQGKVVSDFNCGGLFRAWIEEDENGVERERMMVFKEEYE